MKSISFLVGLSLTLSFAYFAYAKKNTDNPPLTVAQCLALTDTAKIFECLKEVDRQEEDRINKVYNTLMSTIKNRGQADRAELLKRTEIAWIHFRDFQCEFDVSIEGPGEARGAAQAICLIQATQERRRVLQGMLQEEINRE